MSAAPTLAGVQLWQVSLHGQDVAKHKTLLASEELQHLDTLHDAAMRARHVLTRAALRAALSRCVPAVAPQDWRFMRAAHGRPEVAGPDPGLSVSFNIAHTGDEIVLALSTQGSVGVDVEALQRTADALALARRHFMPEELAALEALPATSRQRHFLELWTLKEACVKATGEGLARGLRQFGFVLDQASRIALLPTARVDAARWHCWQWSLAGTHLVALALQGAGKDIPVHWGRLQNLEPVGMTAPVLLRATAAAHARMYSSTNLEP